MHVAGAFSCMEIVDTIYHELMREGDTFIMSKGHGAMAQYVVLEDQGKINLDDYCKGPIGCHPDLHVGGIACATGSLGHGLGIAVGVAYADPTHSVHCLISDGECQEGSTWESLLLAERLDTRNLVVWVDYNGLHSSGDVKLGDLQAKMDHMFEFSVHVVKTTKGYPISYMMDNPIFHYRSPTSDEYQQALRELA